MRQPLTAEEIRVLTLRPRFVPIAFRLARRQPIPRFAWRQMIVTPVRLAGGWLDAAFWLAFVALLAGGFYFIDRGGHATVVDSSTVLGELDSFVGSGRLPVPVTEGTQSLRITVDADTSFAEKWFWCLEADRAIPESQHVCGDGGAPGTPAHVLSERAVTVGPVSPARTYRVQMYCPGNCRWTAEVAPAGAID